MIRVGFGHAVFLVCMMQATVMNGAHASGIGKTTPAWELGIGIGGLSLPDYRGSDHRVEYLLPFPYIRYTGQRLRIDDEGARSMLFSTPRARLDISLAGGLPVSSDNNPVRAGMPDLHPTIELGPALELRLTDPAERRASWWLKVPLRAVLSVDGRDIDHQGMVLAPCLDYEIRYQTHPARHAKVSVAIGPMYADRDWHDYYYRVDPAYATAQRPAFEPPGGYSGSRVTLTWNQRHGRWWYGVFARYDNLSGAVFENSPLVKDHDFFAVGIAVARLLWTGNATD